MAKMEAPPFPRGEVFTQYNDDVTESSTGGTQYEGQEYEFEDVDLTSAAGGVAPHRTARRVLCRIMRNSSGGAVLPKRFVKHKVDGATADLNTGRIGGHATAVTDNIAGIVDEHLPAAGVPDGALFWVVKNGPSRLTSGAAGDTTISVGHAVIPTTDGKGIGALETAAGGDTADITAAIALGLNAPATALTAVAAINTDFVVNVHCNRM